MATILVSCAGLFEDHAGLPVHLSRVKPNDWKVSLCRCLHFLCVCFPYVQMLGYLCADVSLWVLFVCVLCGWLYVLCADGCISCRWSDVWLRRGGSRLQCTTESLFFKLWLFARLHLFSRGMASPVHDPGLLPHICDPVESGFAMRERIAPSVLLIFIHTYILTCMHTCTCTFAQLMDGFCSVFWQGKDQHLPLKPLVNHLPQIRPTAQQTLHVTHANRVLRCLYVYPCPCLFFMEIITEHQGAGSWLQQGLLVKFMSYVLQKVYLYIMCLWTLCADACLSHVLMFLCRWLH